MRNIFISVIGILFAAAASFHILGCQPTYPKEKLTESVVDLCKKEYSIDVKVELAGSTMAIYLPLKGLLDVTFNISQEAQDQIMDVILSASRVALSTDADIRFYCIIAQDMRLPEIQVVIIKYTEDVRRAYYMDISRGEYFKRMLIDMVANPQAKKEEEIKKILGRFEISEEQREELINDFFRTTPIHIKDMGYWQGRFYIKDITMDEFLAEQIAYRIRLRFKNDDFLYRMFLVKSADSRYAADKGKSSFNIEFDIKERTSVPGDKEALRTVFTNVLGEAGDTIYGYKFDNFDFVKMLNKEDSLKLVISREDLYAFKRGRLPLDMILATIHR